MPIPPFDVRGYLPPGVHPATLEEIDERFGRQSEERRAPIESLRWLVDLAKRAGVRRMVINGSFVTDVLQPNDVDCVLLVGEGFVEDSWLEWELRAGLPFLEIQVVDAEEFAWFVDVFFGTDRDAVRKGMVEVTL